VGVIFRDPGPEWWDHEEEAERPLGLFHALVALCGLIAALLIIAGPPLLLIWIWSLLL
jgi:hypothetical protein